MTKRFPLLLLAAGLAACATPHGPSAGAPALAQLAECGSNQHCVSSLATDADHQVAALKLKQLPDTAWPAIVAAVRDAERTTIVQSDAHYLHAEIVSPWHFYTDDLELVLRKIADAKSLRLRREPQACRGAAREARRPRCRGARQPALALGRQALA